MTWHTWLSCRFNLEWNQTTLGTRFGRLLEWHVEHFRLHHQLIIRGNDNTSSHCILTSAERDTSGDRNSQLDSWVLGCLRSNPFGRRTLCRSQHLFFPETCVHLFGEPTFGTSSNIFGKDGHWHTQIFLRLHSGLLCLCLWNEPVTLVLRRHGKAGLHCSIQVPSQRILGLLFFDGESTECLRTHHILSRKEDVYAKVSQRSVYRLQEVLQVSLSTTPPFQSLDVHLSFTRMTLCALFSLWDCMT